MGQSIGLKKIVILSAIASFIFGGGFFINEASAGAGPLCLGKTATEWGALGFNVIIGTNKADRIDGTNGDDVIISLGGNDRVDGKKGNDKICTGDGKDKASGGPGDDMIDPGDDADIVAAGPGADQIFAADGSKDIIDCGKKGGDDFLEADENEKRIKNCDIIVVPYDITSTSDSNDDDDDDDDANDRIRKFISDFLKRFR